MPSPDFALIMARYNLWQNENLVDAASQLSDQDRRQERGAFFGSIQKTFSHLFWGDRIWLSRFKGTPLPGGGIADSLELISNWDDFVVQRLSFDHQILDWARNVHPDWFEGDLNWYSGVVGKQMSKPKSLISMHFFNHQTHHRGQIHAMLTAAGLKPGMTDLGFMPEQFMAL
jgi:uncharacterized damage-inducible protein DinB